MTDFPENYRPAVFISQPMADRTQEEILEERNKAIEKIIKRWPGAIIIDTLFTDVITRGNIGMKYLVMSIEILAEADVAWFCKGWESARGCRIENQCAIEYGIPLVVEDYTEGNDEQ